MYTSKMSGKVLRSLLGLLVVVFLVCVVVEHNTTPEGKTCKKVSDGWFYRAAGQPGKEERFHEECSRNTGAISALLDKAYEQFKEFFLWFGKQLARLTDILYWFEEYVWAAWSIVYRLFSLVASCFWTLEGYAEYAMSLVTPARAVIGTLLCLVALVAFIQYYKPGWIGRVLQFLYKTTYLDILCGTTPPPSTDIRVTNKNLQKQLRAL